LWGNPTVIKESRFNYYHLKWGVNIHIQDYRYSTNRLSVCEWHSIFSDDSHPASLENIVINILTPKVTQSLPPHWQGAYSLERARKWIKERDEEGVTLIVIEQSTQTAIGFVIFLENANSKDLRLGYLLAESAWGKGYASELIRGFVEWCKNNGIASVTGGFERDNVASRRVLEKNGFACEADTNEGTEQMFVLRI